MILVTGASGYVGGRALGTLLRQGFPAVGMIRHAGKGVPGLPPETPLRVANYDDPESLSGAFEGISTLLFISSDGDGRDVLRHHENVINAAVLQSVSSIVFTSIIDIDAESPFYYTPVYQDAERRLRRSGIAWTILRCGLYSDFILENWIKPALSSGTLSLPTGAGQIVPISRHDVALTAATVAASATRHVGNIYELTGPQPLSLHDLARVAGQAFGRSLDFIACRRLITFNTPGWRCRIHGRMPFRHCADP
jgi:NAD(P)H dehydrogenase (quinone)